MFCRRDRTTTSAAWYRFAIHFVNVSLILWTYSRFQSKRNSCASIRICIFVRRVAIAVRYLTVLVSVAPSFRFRFRFFVLFRSLRSQSLYRCGIAVARLVPRELPLRLRSRSSTIIIVNTPVAGHARTVHLSALGNKYNFSRLKILLLALRRNVLVRSESVWTQNTDQPDCSRVFRRPTPVCRWPAGKHGCTLRSTCRE